MDLSQKIIAAILAGFFLVALIRVFSSPFRLALKLLLNTLLGFLALGAVRLTAGLTGIALGLFRPAADYAASRRQISE